MAQGRDLGLHRTFLAHDRTLMAWIRTSTSLISFGFGIYKFFEYLRETEGRHFAQRFGPREFAICMVGIGIFALVLATVQYKRTIKSLEREYGETYKSLAGELAMLLGLMGVGILFVVLFRE